MNRDLDINKDIFPLDVVPNILGFLGERPLSVYRGSQFDVMSERYPQWKAVYNRMEKEYPFWKGYDEDKDEYVILYRYYLNHAALNDWDAFIVLAYSIPSNFSSPELEPFVGVMQATAIWNARVNGNDSLAKELAQASGEYPAYYSMREMTDNQIREMLKNSPITTTIRSVGWIAPNVRRIAAEMYRSRTLHPGTLSNNKTLSILLGRNMLSNEEKLNDLDAIIYTQAAAYPAYTLTDLIPKLDVDLYSDTLNSTRLTISQVQKDAIQDHIDDIMMASILPKNQALIKYYQSRFISSMYDLKLDPLLIEYDIPYLTSREDLYMAKEMSYILDFPIYERVAATNGLKRRKQLKG